MEIRIITSNIRFANELDGEHSWENRLPILKETINSFAPHILGTQEGKCPQIKELANELKQLTLIDQHRNWISERMYPSLYINEDIFSLLDSGDIWLSETPTVPGSLSFNSAFPRLCTWAKVKTLSNAEEVLLCNTHLDHVYSKTREKQAKVLIKELSLINNQNLPLILMGDFNEGPSNDVRKVITNNFSNLIDPWNQSEEGSHHKFNGINKESLRIDWILIDKKFEPKDIYLEKHSKNNIFPSDHFPVKCTILIPNN